MTTSKPLLVLALSGFALAACTNPDGSMNRGANGAVIGGLTGVAIGNAVGGSAESRAIGGVIGAVAGGTIGNQLESQERELRKAMNGTNASVTNTGHSLIVNLPEAITFDFGSAVVHSSLVPSIVAVARSLQNHPNTQVQVIGHTDNIGSSAYNQDLSERRAAAVAQILVNHKTPTSRITVFGRSFNDPIATNATSEGRAANRRVEIVITPNG